jgi:predicted N-formylglutamate amidohydrolase
MRSGVSEPDLAPYRAIFENRMAQGRIVLVCEHASNHIPARWGTLGLNAAARQAHIAWDPGALQLARGLARRLDACLVHAPVSRLVYDLNRAPDQAGAMPARSEIYDIPGNATIEAAERVARTEAVYVPFHDDLHIEIARRIALSLAPVIVTIHSFTPLYHGQSRKVEFGVIHDRDTALAEGILAAAQSSGLCTALNEPYSAADGVTHTLRLQATPYGLPNAMLEIRNDLIASDESADAMAERLAPVLTAALAALTERV